MEIDYKKIHNEFKIIIGEIRKAERIVIFRHENPDFDAFGSQMGLYTWISDNFKDKEVYFVGDSHKTFVPALYPQPMDINKCLLDKPYLAIVCDTGNLQRVACAADAQNFANATSVIKFDHHPNVEPFGKINCVYDELGSCSELIALFIFSMKKRKEILSAVCASYLYSGIVGDTGRFMYSGTSSATLRIAGDLIDCGANIESCYSKMYRTTLEQLELQKWVLNNYKVTEKGTCYYVLSNSDLEKLKITADEGKLYINTFRNVSGVNCVVAVTQDVVKGNWRVSLRGTTKKVNEVASKFRGGGHDFAAGARLESLDELDGLIKSLDEVKIEDVISK